MSKTAKDYQTTLKFVFDFAISQEKVILDDIIRSPKSSDETLAYQRGVIAGLREARRKLDASDFLVED